MRLQFGDKRRLGLVANYLMRNLTVFKQYKRGDGHNAKLLCQLAIFVHIALKNGKTVRHLLSDLLNDGAERTARSAPACPKVYEHGLRRVDDVLLDSLISSLNQ